MENHWRLNPWKFSLRRHGINPLRDENERPLRAKPMKILSKETWYKSSEDENKGHWEQNPWNFSLRRHCINPRGMKIKGHWGQNPWRFSLRRHGINPVRDENTKPLRAKSVIVLSEQTLYKSIEWWNEKKATEDKTRESSLWEDTV
jgi:hypothetical protein